MQICPKCNGKKIDTGCVSGEGELANFGVEYKSDNRKLLRGGVSIRSHVCLNCGHMELMIDTNQLKKKLKK
jgi:hypothetical protein